MTLAVRLNGEARSVPPGTTIAGVVAELSVESSGVAVAVNDAVVPRSAWGSTPVADGDHVEVLTAVQGG